MLGNSQTKGTNITYTSLYREHENWIISLKYANNLVDKIIYYV